jgi:Cu2+-exporting ATPase
MINFLFIAGSLLYSGYKVYTAEKNHTRKRPEPAAQPLPAVLLTAETETETETDNETSQSGYSEQELDHYLKVTGFALTTAGLGVVVAPVFSLPAFLSLVYLEIPLFKTALRNLLVERRVESNSVDAITTVAALGSGYYVLSGIGNLIYFYGYKSIARTEAHTRQTIQSILQQAPQQVWLAGEDDVEIEVPIEAIKAGDVIVLQAGDFVPIDGVVIRGTATCNQQVLTGESRPIEKFAGEPLFASSTVVSGKVYVEVAKAGHETTAAAIQSIIDRTQNFTAGVEAKAVQHANDLAVPTLLIGGATLVTLGPATAISALNCNMADINRLGGPLGVINYLDLVGQAGILVKDGRSLELLSTVDTVVFDKTGTLTLDVPHVAQVHVLGNSAEDELLLLAAAAEHKLSHPIARAIVQETRRRGIEVPSMANACYAMGFGTRVEVDGREVHVGSARFMHHEGILVPRREALLAIEGTADRHGHSLVYVAIDREVHGLIELHATLRPEMAEVIGQLRALDLDIVIISGDNIGPTRYLAEQLGVEHYHANVLPDQKARLIDELRSRGQSVCFVGDGINDSIALKTANVSISLHGASSAALDTAGIVLMRPSLRQLLPLFSYAQELERQRRIGVATTAVPGAVALAGVFFFGFGLHATLLLYVGSGVAAMTNAMWPRFVHRAPAALEFSDQKVGAGETA